MRCPRCEGAWVAEETLVAILEQRASTLVELPWQARADQPRTCPQCRATMQTVDLGTVALDRCPAHGVWFDADELTALLKQVKQFKADPKKDHDAHRTGLLDRLARLFGG